MTTRSRILSEMGIRPQWRLRDAPAIAESASLAPPQETVAPVLLELESAPARIEQAVVMASAPAKAAAPGMDWDELSSTVSACTLCGLCKARKQAVLGVGDRQADWMFVGEGPGAEEDERGEPFVGQAGKLLDAMLSTIGIKRGENVYIANAVKCRPPGNRTPEPEEIATCRPYLVRQIELVQPKILVALGRPAVQTLLGGEMSIAGARGKQHRYGDTPVVVTYHPAYLLRNLPDKAKAWEDLCRAADVITALR